MYAWSACLELSLCKNDPYFIEAGIRVICPDLPGYGKSDKPAAREDYSFQRQVDWMTEWLESK